MLPFLHLLLVSLAIMSCAPGAESGANIANTPAESTLAHIAPLHTDRQIEAQPQASKGNPIWGYRFVLTGDFNGDGQPDTLTERFYDTAAGQETNKFFEGHDLLVGQNDGRSKISFFEANHRTIDTLFTRGDLGVSYAEVVGDIDGDGGDEIAILPTNADVSSLNSIRIYSLKEDGWQLIYGFGVHEWDFPALPGYNPLYGLMGQMGSVNTTGNDTLNQRLQAELDDYQRVQLIEQGVIEYTGHYRIEGDEEAFRFVSFTDESEEEMWLAEANGQFPNDLKERWIAFQIYDKKILEDAKAGTFEILDPATSFRQRAFFK